MQRSLPALIIVGGAAFGNWIALLGMSKLFLGRAVTRWSMVGCALLRVRGKPRSR